MLAAEQIAHARTHEFLDRAHTSAAAFDRRVREEAPLEVCSERRHRVDRGDEGEGVALLLDLLLQKFKDLGVESLQVVEQIFCFHRRFSFRTPVLGTGA